MVMVFPTARISSLRTKAKPETLMATVLATTPTTTLTATAYLQAKTKMTLTQRSVGSQTHKVPRAKMAFPSFGWCCSPFSLASCSLCCAPMRKKMRRPTNRKTSFPSPKRKSKCSFQLRPSEPCRFGWIAKAFGVAGRALQPSGEKTFRSSLRIEFVPNQNHGQLCPPSHPNPVGCMFTVDANRCVHRHRSRTAHTRDTKR